MNNNPISLLFNLTETAAATIAQAAKSGVIAASEEKTNTRMELCSNCKCLDKTTMRCSLCGCFMTVKVRLDAAKCPANKW